MKNLSEEKVRELSEQLKNGHPNRDNYLEPPIPPEYVNDEPEQEESYKTAEFKSFHYLEDGTVSYSILDTIETKKKLTPGSYTLKWINSDEPYCKINVNSGEENLKLYSFKHKAKVDKFIESFFDKKVTEYIKSFNFLHKVGILLHGIEGGGKSSIIRHYCRQLIANNDAIVFHIASDYSFGDVWGFIQNIRKVQKNPIVIVIDEIDEYMRNYEAFLKNALDGNMSIDYSLVFATTNYINKIPDAIQHRPSRFKYVLNIEGIDKIGEIEEILSNVLSAKFSQTEISKFAKTLTGQTLDQLKQFCIDKIMDLDVEKVNKQTIGFNNSK